MGLSEVLSDDGSVTGRGGPLRRGAITGVATGLGGMLDNCRGKKGSAKVFLRRREAGKEEYAHHAPVAWRRNPGAAPATAGKRDFAVRVRERARCAVHHYRLREDD
jgi:hypothetical protein